MLLWQDTNILDLIESCAGPEHLDYNDVDNNRPDLINCVKTDQREAEWNYGANFGGTSSTWTSGASSITMGVAADFTGKGMFGKYAVSDDNYDDDHGGGATTDKMEINMCGNSYSPNGCN